MLDFDFVMQFIGVVALTAFSDVCWTLYFIKTADRHATHAAGWSAVIIFCGAFSTVAYVHDIRLVAAAMCGAWLGTYFTVRWFSNDDDKGRDDGI